MKLYCDNKNIYKVNPNGISLVFPVVDDKDELIITGIHVSEFEEDNAFLPANCEFSFINKKYNRSKIKFYCVPFIDIFGYDDNGYYATFNDFTSENCKSKIIHIDNCLNIYFVAKNFSDFSNMLFNGSLKKHKYKTNDLIVYNSYLTAKKEIEKYGKLYF